MYRSANTVWLKAMKNIRIASRTLLAATSIIWLIGSSHSYEIPNHADMSQTAVERSVLNTFDGSKFTKLVRLGLRSATLDDRIHQIFPLSSGLPPHPDVLRRGARQRWCDGAQHSTGRAAAVEHRLGPHSSLDCQPHSLWSLLRRR